eukprot:scaffold967_cov321-Pavlova_lutheri.AAC.21
MVSHTAVMLGENKLATGNEEVLHWLRKARRSKPSVDSDRAELLESSAHPSPHHADHVECSTTRSSPSRRDEFARGHVTIPSVRSPCRRNVHLCDLSALVIPS